MYSNKGFLKNGLRNVKRNTAIKNFAKPFHKESFLNEVVSDVFRLCIEHLLICYFI